MRDAGVPSRREQAKVAHAMAKTMQERLARWTEENFPYFEQTMELVRTGAPVQYLKLYMEAIKLGIVKESNINININRQQDRENLQALVRTRIALPDRGEYVPYEEIQPVKAERVETVEATLGTEGSAKELR